MHRQLRLLPAYRNCLGTSLVDYAMGAQGWRCFTSTTSAFPGAAESSHSQHYRSRPAQRCQGNATAVRRTAGAACPRALHSVVAETAATPGAAAGSTAVQSTADSSRHEPLLPESAARRVRIRFPEIRSMRGTIAGSMRVVPVNERLHFMFTNVRKRSPLLMHLTMLDSNLKMLLEGKNSVLRK